MVCNALQGKTNFVLTSCSTIFTWILLQRVPVPVCGDLRLRPPVEETDINKVEFLTVHFAQHP